MKKIEDFNTIIFDLGGVLINLDLQRCIKSFNKLGISDLEKKLNLFGQTGFFLKFEKGLINVENFRDEVRKMSDREITDEQIDEAWCDFLCDIPTQKIEILVKLKEKYNLLMLSNTNPLHIEICTKREFSRHGLMLSDVFDKCYFSYQMHLAKPDPKIFETLLHDAGLKAEQCLFIDDGPKNIETARNLGFYPYLYNIGEKLDFLLDKNFTISR